MSTSFFCFDRWNGENQPTRLLATPEATIFFVGVVVVHTEDGERDGALQAKRRFPLVRHSTAILLPLLFSGYIELPSISSSLAADGCGYLVEQCEPCAHVHVRHWLTDLPPLFFYCLFIPPMPPRSSSPPPLARIPLFAVGREQVPSLGAHGSDRVH
jgi:hypothetical protein